MIGHNGNDAKRRRQEQAKKDLMRATQQAFDEKGADRVMSALEAIASYGNFVADAMLIVLRDESKVAALGGRVQAIRILFSEVHTAHTGLSMSSASDKGLIGTLAAITRAKQERARKIKEQQKQGVPSASNADGAGESEQAQP